MFLCIAAVKIVVLLKKYSDIYLNKTELPIHLIINVIFP
jgi:hypothetical protein